MEEKMNQQYQPETWICFDKTQETIQEFLANNSPLEKFSKPVRWILVDVEEEEDDDDDENDEVMVSQQVKMLEKLGTEFERSFREEENLKEPEKLTLLIDGLVEKFISDKDLLMGKWMIFLHEKDVERIWSTIVMSIYEEKLGSSHCCKISLKEAQEGAPPESGQKKPQEYVILVYTRNYLCMEDVFDVREKLRKLGIRWPITYKPDVYTYLGIYRGNLYKIRPFRYRR
eukprot:Sdes_comp17843_c1_seq1m7116